MRLVRSARGDLGRLGTLVMSVVIVLTLQKVCHKIISHRMSDLADFDIEDFIDLFVRST